jgi:hypothetical protein
MLVRRPNGRSYRIGESLRLSHGRIPDGIAYTLLLSEKRMDLSLLGQKQQDDDQGFVAGWDWDTIRWARWEPTRDHVGGPPTPGRFGSSHLAGINAVFADGAVRMIRFDIQSNYSITNPGVWQRLCIRDDGMSVSLDN